MIEYIVDLSLLFLQRKKAECRAGRKILFSFVENCDKINPLSVKKIIHFKTKQKSGYIGVSIQYNRYI